MKRKRRAHRQTIPSAELRRRSLLDRSRGARPGTNDLYISIVEIVGPIVDQGMGLGSRQKGRSGIRRDSVSTGDAKLESAAATGLSLPKTPSARKRRPSGFESRPHHRPPHAPLSRLPR